VESDGQTIQSAGPDGDGFDGNYRYGDSGAPRLIIMFVGTAPSSCSQTGSSFFGDPNTFASQNYARILCMYRDGAQYSFEHVPTYVGYVKAQLQGGQTLFVAGYSNGGGVAACVGSSIGAYAFADWAGTANWPARGCDRNIGRTALFSTTGDRYRSAELAAFKAAGIADKQYFTDTPGSHVTPMPASVRSPYWTFLLNSGPGPGPSPSSFTIWSYMDNTKCIDIPGGDAFDGAKLWMWDCNGTPQQQWIFTAGSWRIESAFSRGKCIDAASAQDGVQLQLWECNGLYQQIIGYDSNMGTIYLAQSTSDSVSVRPTSADDTAVNSSIPRVSKCVDLAGGDPSIETAVQIWDCNGHTNQGWGFGSSLGPRTRAKHQQHLDGGTANLSSAHMNVRML